MTLNASIDKYLSYCTSVRLSPYTVRSYRSVLHDFSKYLRSTGVDPDKLLLKDVSKAMLMDYFFYIQSNNALSTVKTKRIALTSFFNWLVEDMEVLDFNPVKSCRLKIKHEDIRQPVVQIADVSSLMKLIDGVSPVLRDKSYYKFRLAIQLLYGCGLRISELCSLSYSSFNESESCFTVIAKGHKTHTAYVTNQDALQTLAACRALNRGSSDYVFDSPHGGHLSTVSLRNLIYRWYGRIGYNKHFSPHSYRRGCATNLIENGVDVLVVKDVLGHANVSTTARYVRLSDKAVRDTMINHCPLNKIG